jgi:DNA mismatch repair protein MutS2
MDEHTQNVLEFPSVLAWLADYTRTRQGRAALLQTQPWPHPAQPRICLDEVEEAARFLAAHGRPLGELGDAETFLEELLRPDCLLGPPELLAVAEYLRFAETIRRRLPPGEYPALARRVQDAPPPPLLLNRIENAIDEKGEIRDSAHPELRTVRQRQERARRQLLDLLGRFLQGPQAASLAPEAFVTQRNDRYVIPVRVECRREVPGLVHGTSSSGATVFVEPLAVVELNNEYVFAREREAEIIREVLAALSREARQHRALLSRIVEISGLLDARFAVAEWAANRPCCRPEFSSAGRLELSGARHPLLMRSLGAERVVPIDIQLTEDARVLVISGPNTGGKTAALKTAGLICLMARCGLPVPARSAELPWFEDVFADIGDFQSIEQHLSTFSSHLSRLIEVLHSHRAPSLVLLDELGRGTDPVYGAALATAILDWFRAEGSFVLATTHHRHVKLYAATTPGVRNASVLLDPSTQRPIYALQYGVAGDSSGLEIACQMGLPATILERAAGLLEDRDRQWEDYLQQLRRELDRVREREQELEAARRRLEELGARLRAESAEAELRRQKEFDQALARLGDEFRHAGNRYLKRLVDQQTAREERRRLSLREAALKESFRRRRQAETEPPAATQPPTLQPGDLVYHPVFKFRGRVEAVEGDRVRVDVGGKSMTTRLQELRRIETREVEEKPAQDITVRVVQSTDPELTLIGMTVEEAVDTLDKFLDRAFVSRLPEVRVIHGFGTGRLKRSIGQFLSVHPHVAGFEVEGGATRVILKS